MIWMYTSLVKLYMKNKFYYPLWIICIIHHAQRAGNTNKLCIFMWTRQSFLRLSVIERFRGMDPNGV